MLHEMSRRTIVLAIFALGVVVVVGVGYAARRRSVSPPARALATTAPETLTLNDSTWCGAPIGSANTGELRDASDCGKISFTGTAPECVFWAECREVHFSLDCSKGGPGQCRCDGEGGRIVPYDPAFCALDAANPKGSLRAILDRAAEVCRWTPKQ
jgi:hypothetical protein